MGEIADMMLDGTMCQGCGVWLHGGRDGPGYPGYCRDCAREVTKARPSVAPEGGHAKIECPTCRKRVRPAGLKDHQRDVHGATAPPPIAAEGQPAQPSMVEGDTLPISLWQFEQRANVLLSNEQEKASPDNALIGFICDAVRLARENARQHPEQQPDIDARDGRDRIAYAPFGRCAKCGEAITSFHNTGNCSPAAGQPESASSAGEQA